MNNRELITLAEFIKRQGADKKAAGVLGYSQQQLFNMKRAVKPVFVCEQTRRVFSLLREY